MDSNDDTDCNTDSNNATVTEAEAKIAMLTGVADVDIIEHKRLSAQGKFKVGVGLPLKYIIMGSTESRPNATTNCPQRNSTCKLNEGSTRSPQMNKPPRSPRSTRPASRPLPRALTPGGWPIRCGAIPPIWRSTPRGKSSCC